MPNLSHILSCTIICTQSLSACLLQVFEKTISRYQVSCNQELLPSPVLITVSAHIKYRKHCLMVLSISGMWRTSQSGELLFQAIVDLFKRLV